MEKVRKYQLEVIHWELQGDEAFARDSHQEIRFACTLIEEPEGVFSGLKIVWKYRIYNSGNHLLSYVVEDKLYIPEMRSVTTNDILIYLMISNGRIKPQFRKLSNGRTIDIDYEVNQSELQQWTQMLKLL